MRKKYISVFIVILILASCKKKETPPVTRPVEFTSTSYATLGTFDNSGKPTVGLDAFK